MVVCHGALPRTQGGDRDRAGGRDSFVVVSVLRPTAAAGASPCFGTALECGGVTATKARRTHAGVTWSPRIALGSCWSTRNRLSSESVPLFRIISLRGPCNALDLSRMASLWDHRTVLERGGWDGLAGGLERVGEAIMVQEVVGGLDLGRQGNRVWRVPWGKGGLNYCGVLAERKGVHGGWV